MPDSPAAPHSGPTYRQLHWPRPLAVSPALAAVQAWAADQSSPRIVLETRADLDGITYCVGAMASRLPAALRKLTAAVPGIEVTAASASRLPVAAAGRLALSTRHRALSPEAVEPTVRQLHAVLADLNEDETVVLQTVLGPRRIPLAVPNQSPSSIVLPWYQVAWAGNGGRVDPEKRAALRDKVSRHGFAATVRIGVLAPSRSRREALLRAVFGALQIGEAPGLKARLKPTAPRTVNEASSPLRWPLRLNSAEVLAVAGWPIGDQDLPGLPPLHPRRIAPAQLATEQDLIVADALAPGITGRLGYSVDDAMRGTWALGPTGVGKTTFLLNRIHQDLVAGRAVVVIEPKDLVAEVLAVVPDQRRDDVVLLNPTDRQAVVGVNPLQTDGGRSPDLVADGLLATFRALYDDQLGPRSTDILSNCLNVLTRHESASLVMIMPLLTNPGFRRSLTAAAIKSDPISAGPFWAWFEALTDEARSQAIAPLSNKLRPLLRPQLRAVLGQRRPKVNLRAVLNDGKVLLVPLQPGVIGPDAAELLAAVLIAELWNAIRERAAVPAANRPPAMIYIDEVQQYLRTPVDLADALATSRSLQAAWTLAHQFRGQLPTAMLAAFETNLRSRVAFQLNATDARALSAGQSVLTAEDFTALPAFHVYAQLVRGNSLQPWASGVTLPPPKPTADAGDIRRRSRSRYARPLDDIEAGFAELLTPTAQPSSAGSRTAPPNIPASGRRRRQP